MKKQICWVAWGWLLCSGKRQPRSKVPISLAHTPCTQDSPRYVYNVCSANACSLNGRTRTLHVWKVDYLTETLVVSWRSCLVAPPLVRPSFSMLVKRMILALFPICTSSCSTRKSSQKPSLGLAFGLSPYFLKKISKPQCWSLLQPWTNKRSLHSYLDLSWEPGRRQQEGRET